MIPDSLLPAAIVLTSLVPGLLIFVLDEDRHVLRTVLNMAGALAKLALVGWLIQGVYEGRVFESRLTLAPGLDLVVMGTLEHRGIPGFFIGNTAEDVLQTTQASVLAIKPFGFVSPVMTG